jgi:hypothetical protein
VPADRPHQGGLDGRIDHLPAHVARWVVAGLVGVGLAAHVVRSAGSGSVGVGLAAHVVRSAGSVLVGVGLAAHVVRSAVTERLRVHVALASAVGSG